MGSLWIETAGWGFRRSGSATPLARFENAAPVYEIRPWIVIGVIDQVDGTSALHRAGPCRWLVPSGGAFSGIATAIGTAVTATYCEESPFSGLARAPTRHVADATYA